MKTIEEKAKAYDEALKRAKDALNDGTISNNTIAYLQDIFPELAESEDEKIRKELIEHIKANKWADYVLFQKFSPDDVIAWLEKQESVEEIVERCKKSWYNEGKIAGMAEGLSDDEKYQQGWHDALEQQGEQPFAIRWYDVSLIPQEDEELLVEWDSNDATWHEIAFYHADTNTFWNGTRQVEDVTRWCYITDLIKKQDEKPADKIVPKFKVKYACGEYNVLEIKEIAGIMYYGIEDEPNHIDYVLPENCEIISGYGVKDKGSQYPTKSATFLGQNSAWSEEDERTRKTSISFLKDYADKGYENAVECIDWLNSLKPQKQGEKPQCKTEEKTDNENKVASAWNNGYSNGYIQAVEKAVEWLENHNDYIDVKDGNVTYFDMWKCVEDFRKYMETLEIKGLGRTDFRPVFNRVDELVSEHEFSDLKGIIYFTDGLGTFPSKKPAYETAFIISSESSEVPDLPPWAIQMTLSENQLEREMRAAV